MLTRLGTVTTLNGARSGVSNDGDLATADFDTPAQAMAVSATEIYVTDATNNLRKIDLVSGVYFSHPTNTSILSYFPSL